MSPGRMSALLFSVLLPISYISSPGYCEDVQSPRELVLSEFISIARAVYPLPTHEIEEFGSYFAIATPNQYKGVEALFTKMRQLAAQTDSASQYAEASSAANSLLRGLDQAAPQLAHQLFESWPIRPDLGDSYNKFNSRFEGDRQRNRMIADPMDYLRDQIPVDNTNAWMAVVSILQSSRPDDARNAFREILDKSEKQPDSSISTAHAVSIFLNLDLWDAHLFSRYVNLLRRAGKNGMGYEISCDDRFATLDYSEGEAFRVIVRAVPNHLKLARELLDAVPSLKDKTEQIGGLEAIWDRGQLRGKAPYVNSPVLYRGNNNFKAELDTLCRQFRESPDQFRQRILDLQSAKDFDFLSRAVALGRCPAVKDIISDLARQIVLNEPNAGIRMSMALQLMPYYYDNTRLDPKWIDFGIEILRRSGARTASLDRCEFENRLVNQFALVDFSYAMAYINSLKEPLSRLQLFRAVMQALDREIWRGKH